MVDIYKENNLPAPSMDEYPDNPGKFGTALKLLTDAKQLMICHMGFRFDSYMGWCSSRCSYCYARGQNMRYGRWPVENIKLADLDEIKQQFKKVFVDKKDPAKHNTTERCIAHKYPIRLGTQTDCFQLCEEKYRVTYKFIDEIMNKYDYPYTVCTKHKRVTAPEYMDLYGKNSTFQFTLSTLKEDYLDKIENGASTAVERLEAMKILADAGYRVVCRISPYIPEYMDDIEELVKCLSASGCTHVVSELLRISPILNQVMIDEVGFDVMRYYKNMGVKMNAGYYRYPLKKKIEFQKYLKDLCDKHNMTFATCGDEDPSFHTSDNCCGFDGIESFEKGCPFATYDTAYKICAEKKELTFEEFMAAGWCPDTALMRKVWDSGYIEQVLMNLEFDKNTNKYYFVDCNQKLLEVNPDLNKNTLEDLFE